MFSIARQNVPYVVAIGIGLFFALSARYLFSTAVFARAGGLLTLSFLVIMPLSLGALSAHFTPPYASKTWRVLWNPAVTVLLFIVSALLFHFEGMICILIIFPLFILAAAIGATLYVVWEKKYPPRNRTYTVGLLVVAPFLAAVFETWYAAPTSFRRVENTILIQAPAAVVWQHITRVPPISTTELGPSLVDKLGFPRPVEATLSHEGVGGVRHATFERGVEFIETVDVWEPRQRLSFSIRPNTATIPPTTFDEHVTIGGRFFDVLHGTYELHPVSPTQTRLVLYSQQRLSTRLNFYAGLWTNYIMSDIQQRILAVIQRRCETSPAVVQ